MFKNLARILLAHDAFCSAKGLLGKLMSSTKQQMDSPGGKHFLSVLAHERSLFLQAKAVEHEVTTTTSAASSSSLSLHHHCSRAPTSSNQNQTFKRLAHLTANHDWGPCRRRLACSTRHLSFSIRGREACDLWLYYPRDPMDCAFPAQLQETSVEFDYIICSRFVCANLQLCEPWDLHSTLLTILDLMASTYQMQRGFALWQIQTPNLR